MQLNMHVVRTHPCYSPPCIAGSLQRRKNLYRKYLPAVDPSLLAPPTDPSDAPPGPAPLKPSDSVTSQVMQEMEEGGEQGAGGANNAGEKPRRKYRTPDAIAANNIAGALPVSSAINDGASGSGLSSSNKMTPEGSLGSPMLTAFGLNSTFSYESAQYVDKGKRPMGAPVLLPPLQQQQAHVVNSYPRKPHVMYTPFSLPSNCSWTKDDDGIELVSRRQVSAASSGRLATGGVSSSSTSSTSHRGLSGTPVLASADLKVVVDSLQPVPAGPEESAVAADDDDREGEDVAAYNREADSMSDAEYVSISGDDDMQQSIDDDDSGEGCDADHHPHHHGHHQQHHRRHSSHSDNEDDVGHFAKTPLPWSVNGHEHHSDQDVVTSPGLYMSTAPVHSRKQHHITSTSAQGSSDVGTLTDMDSPHRRDVSKVRPGITSANGSLGSSDVSFPPTPSPVQEPAPLSPAHLTGTGRAAGRPSPFATAYNFSDLAEAVPAAG